MMKSKQQQQHPNPHIKRERSTWLCLSVVCSGEGRLWETITQLHHMVNTGHHKLSSSHRLLHCAGHWFDFLLCLCEGGGWMFLIIFVIIIMIINLYVDFFFNFFLHCYFSVNIGQLIHIPAAPNTPKHLINEFKHTLCWCALHQLHRECQKNLTRSPEVWLKRCCPNIPLTKRDSSTLCKTCHIKEYVL